MSEGFSGIGEERLYLVLLQLQVPQLIDSQRLICSMEKRNVVDPCNPRRHRLAVDQETRKQQTNTTSVIS